MGWWKTTLLNWTGNNVRQYGSKNPLTGSSVGLQRGTHCWSSHAAPRRTNGTAGFGLYHLRMQRWRGDELPRSGLDRHLVGHFERLSQGQDDLIGLGLHGRHQENKKQVRIAPPCLSSLPISSHFRSSLLFPFCNQASQWRICQKWKGSWWPLRILRGKS